MPRYIADAGRRVSIPRPTITYNSACIHQMCGLPVPAHPTALYQLVDAVFDNDIDTPVPASLGNLPGGGATTTTSPSLLGPRPRGLQGVYPACERALLAL